MLFIIMVRCHDCYHTGEEFYYANKIVYSDLEKIKKVFECQCATIHRTIIMAKLINQIIETNDVDLLTVVYNEYRMLFDEIYWPNVFCDNIQIEILLYLHSINMLKYNKICGYCLRTFVQKHEYDMILWLKDHDLISYCDVEFRLFDKDMILWWLDNNMPVHPSDFFDTLVIKYGFCDALKLLEEYGHSKPHDSVILSVLLNHCTLDDLIGWHETLDKVEAKKLRIVLDTLDSDTLMFCMDNFNVVFKFTDRFSEFKYNVFSDVDDINIFRRILNFSIGKSWNVLNNVNCCYGAFSGHHERDEKVLLVFCETFDAIPDGTHVLTKLYKHGIKSLPTWWLTMCDKYNIPCTM